MPLISLLGKIWALPTTVVGLVYAFIGYCFAPCTVKIGIACNAICFYNFPFLKGRAAGLTLGNVVLLKEDPKYYCSEGKFIAEHEKQHTLQAEVLGIFYLPLHAFFFLKYRKAPLENPLERGPYSTPPRPW